MRPETCAAWGMARNHLVKADADIPAVQTAIAIMSQVARAHWNLAVARALKSLDDALSRIPEEPGESALAPVANAKEKDEALQAIVLGLLLLLKQELELPLAPSSVTTLRDVGEKLLLEGAKSVDQVFSVSTRGGHTAATLVETDFRALFSWHFENASPAVFRELREFVVSPEARETRASPLKPGGAVDGSFGKSAWDARLEKALGAGGQFVDGAVDTWAYRAHSLGIFEGLVVAGARAIRIFNNPPTGPDARTTPLCRYLHGRQVPLARAKEQVAEYLAALQRRDYDAAARAWPLLKVTASDGEERLLEILRSAGVAVALPPYHRRCRTQLEGVFE